MEASGGKELDYQLSAVSASRSAVSASMPEELDYQLSEAYVKKGSASWFVAGALCISATGFACAVCEFVSVQEKRRSRRRHSGPKTWQASRLQVS